MNELTIPWKLFRAMCIFQMVLAVIQVIISVSNMFFYGFFSLSLLYFIAYCLVFVFVYQGLSLLNYNYPDTPLSDNQKRTFNWLYLLNFLNISVLFSRVLNTWWIIPFLQENENLRLKTGFVLLSDVIMAVLSFLFHLIFLFGIYQLRRLIFKNTLHTWYSQFGEDKKEAH